MNKSELIFELYKIGAIQFGEFTLKSGKTSSYYINLRKIISYPSLLKNIAQMLSQKITAANIHYDLICGVPYTALPIATCVSITNEIPMILRRKEKKEYGTKQLIEGEFAEHQYCLVIEDIITTGSSILETSHDLIAAGLQVTDVIAVIDREEGGAVNLQSKQFNVHSLLKLSEVFATLLNSTHLSSEARYQLETLQSAKLALC